MSQEPEEQKAIADRTESLPREGWTGLKCEECRATGVDPECNLNSRPCTACGGTGDQWGPLSDLPSTLP